MRVQMEISMQDIKVEKFTSKKHLYAFVIIVSFVILQCLYVFWKNPCASVSDEFTYKQLAYDIYKLKPVSTFHYPFLYPLVLSMSFFGGDSFYVCMLATNIIVKTLILTGIYRLMYLMSGDAKKSSYFLGLIAVTPVYFLYSDWIMSENLYAPLLVVTILYYIKYRGILIDEQTTIGNKTVFSAVAGLLAVLLYETKYLSLVLFPILFVYWFWDILRQCFKIRKCSLESKGNRKNELSTLVISLVVYVGMIVFIIAGVAVAYCIMSGIGFSLQLLKDSMGFSIGSGPENTGYRILPKFKWVICYFLYAFLCMVLPLCFCIKEGLRKKMDVSARVNIIFMNFIIFGFMYVAARHSSFVDYNAQGAMLKLLGRYVAYAALVQILILWIISNIVTRREVSEKIKIGEKIALPIAMSIMIILSYLILYVKVIWNPAEDWLCSLRGLENNGFLKLGIVFVSIFVIVLIIIGLFYNKRAFFGLYTIVSVINIVCAVNASDFYLDTKQYMKTTAGLIREYGSEQVSVYSTTMENYLGSMQCFSFLYHDQLEGEIWFLQTGFCDSECQYDDSRKGMFVLNKKDVNFEKYCARTKIVRAENSDIFYFVFNKEAFDMTGSDVLNCTAVDKDYLYMEYDPQKDDADLVFFLDNIMVPYERVGQTYIFKISNNTFNLGSKGVIYNLTDLSAEQISLLKD